MNELTLYAYTFRSRAERIIWTLNEFEFPYTLIRLDPFKGETASKNFLKLNPAKKVPVLVHGTEIFTESLAIMEYLNDISTHIKLTPTEPLARYHYNRAISYCATEIEPYLWLADQNSRLQAYYQWPDGTAATSIQRVRSAIPLVFKWLMEQPYIAGDQFTLADIYYYQCLTWANNWAIDLPTHVADYLQKLAKRPAFPNDMLNPASGNIQ